MKKDKQLKYKLSEQGEARAVEVLGGQDIANVAAGFMNIIKLHGNALNNQGYEPDVKTYFEIVRFAQIMKNCGDWDTLVKTLEKDLEDNSEYFEKNPHSSEVKDVNTR
jgi:hypothetical protein